MRDTYLVTGTGIQPGDCAAMQYLEFLLEREKQIIELAHLRWLLRGCPQGTPEIDWFAAEREFDQAFVDQLELGIPA